MLTDYIMFMFLEPSKSLQLDRVSMFLIISFFQGKVCVLSNKNKEIKIYGLKYYPTMKWISYRLPSCFY